MGFKWSHFQTSSSLLGYEPQDYYDLVSTSKWRPWSLSSYFWSLYTKTNRNLCEKKPQSFSHYDSFNHPDLQSLNDYKFVDCRSWFNINIRSTSVISIIIKVKIFVLNKLSYRSGFPILWIIERRVVIIFYAHNPISCVNISLFGICSWRHTKSHSTQI